MPVPDDELQFRSLVEGVPGVLYLDEPVEVGRILYLSPRIEDLLGYTPQELAVTTDVWLSMVVHPDDHAFVVATAARNNEGSRERIEYRCRTKSGDVVWVLDESVGVTDETGKVIAVRGFLFDITDRKRAEESLRDAEERFRKLVEEAPAIVYVDAADEIGSAVYISPQIEQLLGYTVDEWMATPEFFIDVVLHPDDRDQLLEEIQLNNNGVANGSEYRCLAKDGRVVWFYDESWPQRDEQGRVVATRGFMLDISARKQAEAELALREDQLRRAQRMESVGRLAGGIAHDFNNLLTVIRGHLDLLLADGDTPSAIREQLADVSLATERATRLTGQLLAFGRQQVLQPAPLALEQVLESLGSMFQRLIPADVTLVVWCDPELPRVLADRGQIEQVLANLVINARDAMPDGGTLTIEALSASHETDRQDGVPAGRYVELRVSDVGEGMNEETLEHIFEPFFTTKESGRGTGLGLATVEGIVAQTGGHIVVRSAPGEGTTIAVFLPVVDTTVELGEPAAPVVAAPGSETVLVVEDDAGVRRLVKRLLVGLGYAVVEAAEPRAALALVDDGLEFELLLTDLVMPGGNGRDLAEQVARLRPDVGVLLMSGYTDDELVRRGVQTGSAAFLQKPFRRDDFARRVREVLDARPA